MSDQSSLWPQAREHFRRLCALDRTDRDAELSALRAADPALAAYVGELLAADAETDHDLRSAVDDLRDAFEDDTFAPATAAGPWQLEQPLGRGGMGEVWRAWRRIEDFEQVAALKLLKRGMDSDAMLARFRQERRILARLEHPNIARLLDGGVTETGRPYLAMELVEGRPINEYVAAQGLDLRAILQLFLRICAAVDFAHRNLVVHRDIKPSNILIDPAGEPKLLDFGIAKLLTGDEDDALVTATLLRVMTPAYAAPEQLGGKPVTTATDVYALGLILYELITGGLPRERGAHTSGQITRFDTDVTTRPSQALRRRTVTAPADEHAQRLLRQAAGNSDLDAIVLMALRADPARRYLSVAALAADIEHLLAGRPVMARGDSAGYRLRRFVSRNRVGVTAAALVVVALASGLTSSLWQAQQARAQAQRAEAVQDFLLGIFRTNASNQPDPVRARETTARELLDIGAERIGSALDDAPAAKHAVLALLGSLYQDLGIDEQAAELREQAATLARERHGPWSLAYAQALLDLASSLHTSARLDERVQLLEQADAILARRRDAPVAQRANLLRSLSEHYSSSDVPRAIVYAQRAVALLDGEPPSATLAETYYMLGVAHYFGGDNQAAASAFTRAVEISELVAGFPNPALPRFYALLASVQQSLLEIEPARRSARKALAAATHIGGPEHVDTQQTTMRLGRLLFDTGAVHEGLRYLAEARRLALATRGADDPFYTPQALLEHGFALVRAGDPAAGLADIEAAIDNRRRHRPGTLYLAQMLEYAALALFQLGRTAEIDALLQEAAQIRTDANQARGIPTWNLHVNLRARLAAATGQEELARQWLAEFALSVDPHVGLSLEQIDEAVLRAELMLELGDFPAAAAAAAEALATLVAFEVDDYFVVQRARALHVQGRTALAAGDTTGGCDALQRSHELGRRHLLPGSPLLLAIDGARSACR
jgi:eukaryotic-like serine/threonine-protein kinase